MYSFPSRIIMYCFFNRKFASGDHLEVLLNVAAERLFVKLDTAFQNQKAVRPVELLTAFTADLQNVMCFGLDM